MKKVYLLAVAVATFGFVACGGPATEGAQDEAQQENTEMKEEINEEVHEDHSSDAHDHSDMMDSDSAAADTTMVEEVEATDAEEVTEETAE